MEEDMMVVVPLTMLHPLQNPKFPEYMALEDHQHILLELSCCNSPEEFHLAQ
jgi:hypothetical protein